MAQVVGVNIYIDGVKHNSTPQPLIQQNYNISDVKNPGDSFDIQFSFVYDDDSESKLTAIQSYTLSLEDEEPTVPIGVLNAWQGAVTEDSFTVSAKLIEDGDAVLNVYDDVNRTNLVTQSALTTSVDLTVKLRADGLTNNTQYYWSITTGGETSPLVGKCKTFPQGTSSFKVVTSSCASGTQFSDTEARDYRVSNNEVFDGIRYQHPDSLMFIHTGDIHYRDIGSDAPKNGISYIPEFEQAYDDVLFMQRQQKLYLSTPIAYIWDDHDYGRNDSDSSDPAREDSIYTYKKRIPHYPLVETGVTSPIHQSFAIGRVRFILLDTRSQRVNGVTFLGETQKQWLKDTLLNSTEEVFGIAVGVPWIISGTDGEDTWNGAASERAEIMQFIADNNLTEKVFMFAGDAHCIAIDDGTNNEGIPMYQFASLDSDGSVKGGAYSEGSFAGRNQYGVFEVTDNGYGIRIKGSGYKYKDGIEEKLVEFEKVYETSTSGDTGNLQITSPEDNEQINEGESLEVQFFIDSTSIDMTSPEEEEQISSSLPINVKFSI